MAEYEAYKDSGTPWMGMIPAHWKTERAKWHFTIRNERGNETPVLLAATQKYGMYPQDMIEGVVKVADGTDVQQFRTVHKGDFVISLRSFQGGFEKSDYEGVCSPAYQVFFADDSWDNDYLKYLFKNELFIDAMNALTVGIREGRNIKYEDFADSVLAIPPLAEQVTIAAYLGRETERIDAIIAKAKASIEEYKAWKASIIYEAVTKGLDPNVEMKDSGVEWIGTIPNHWSVIKAARTITSTQNGLTRRDLVESKGQIVLKLKNISAAGVLDYTSINRIELSKSELATYVLQDGDFLFVRVNGSRNLVGKCAIFSDIGEPVAYNDHIIRVRLNDIIEKEYFYWYLLSDAGKREIELHTSTAAGQFTISGSGLRDIFLTLPPINEQQTISKFLRKRAEPLDEIIEERQKLIADLEEYKKSLIFEVVTGKRKVV